MSALLRTSPRIFIPDRKRCRDCGVVWLSGGMRGGGKLHDVSLRKRHGTLTNGPVWTSGKFGEPACDFTSSGSTQYIDIPQFLASAPVSYSAWYYWDNANNGSVQTIICQTDESWYIEEDMCVISDGWANHGKVYAYTTSYPFEVGLFSSATLSVGWNHIAVTHSTDTGGYNIYINGQNSGSTTASSGPVGTKTYIGKRRNLDSPTYGDYWKLDSEVSLISVHNRILTAAQVSRLYSRPFYLYRNPPSQFNVGWAGTATTVPGAPTPRLGRRPTRFFRSSF